MTQKARQNGASFTNDVPRSGVATVNRDLSFHLGTGIVPERSTEPTHPAREEKRETIIRKNEALAAVEVEAPRQRFSTIVMDLRVAP